MLGDSIPSNVLFQAEQSSFARAKVNCRKDSSLRNRPPGSSFNSQKAQQQIASTTVLYFSCWNLEGQSLSSDFQTRNYRSFPKVFRASSNRSVGRLPLHNCSLTVGIYGCCLSVHLILSQIVLFSLSACFLQVNLQVSLPLKLTPHSVLKTTVF